MNTSKIFSLREAAQDALPLVFDSPHSGRVYPPDFGYACSFALLEQAEDRYVDGLFDCAPDYGAALLAAQFPRSYIDVNRAEDDVDPQLLAGGVWDEARYGPINPTDRSDAGIGLIRRLVKPGIPVYTKDLSAEDIVQRLNGYYRPYHKTLENLLNQAYYNFGAVWHINCHSMPDHAAIPRNPIGIVGRDKPRSADFVLGDRDGTTANIHFTHMIRDFLKDMGYKVTINDPFKGVELVHKYSDPARGRQSIQIEINKNLYMNEISGNKSRNYNKLKNDVEKLVCFVSDHVRSQLVQKAAD
jgi:N-formylglutamate deformylase